MRPNILLLMPDQLRADWEGPGNVGGARTPHIDGLARRGMTFAKAICPSPICGPSRASLATGFEYDRCSVPNNNFSVGVDEPNFYRALAHAGYQVLTCGKLDLLKGELDWGIDGQHAGGSRNRLRELGFTGGLDSGGKHAVLFADRAGRDEPYLHYLRGRGLADIHVADFAARRNPGLGHDADMHPGAGPNFLNTRPSALPDNAYQDDWIGQCGLDLIRDAATAGPWFLQVNFAGPHEPMNVSAEMAASVEGYDPPPPSAPGGLDAATHRAVRKNYTAMVERIDTIVGRYVELLHETGQIDNTIIIFTSDHGEMLGDCGLWEKFVPHQASLAIPLIFAGPGVVHARIDAPATFLDIHATVSELAGAEAIAGIDSRSMVATLRNPAHLHRDIVFSGLGDWRIAYDGTHKLVAGYDPAEARRDMENGRFDPAAAYASRLVEPAADPAETRDLAAEKPEIANKLGEQLLANARKPRPQSASGPMTTAGAG